MAQNYTFFCTCARICVILQRFLGMSTAVFRILSYIRHYLTAWNTTGEGIHSPWLFRLVSMIMRDENSFYCFRTIEGKRAMLKACTDEIDVMDYGSAGSPEGEVIHRRVCDIAQKQLERPKMGQLLFRIVHFMGGEEKRALEILELGTSLGVTTAYLASVSSKNRVMTMEGSEEVLKIAQGVWRSLVLENIEYVQGAIDTTLYKYARERLDVVFVDANHTYEATKRYVDFLLPRMNEKGVIVIDDIYYSPEMQRAWEEIKADSRVTTTIDVYHAGLVFVDPHYLKRHYRVKI